MALTKTIDIDGKQVTFRASAALPRLYRIRYGRDLMRDLTRISRNMEEAEEAAKAKGAEPDKYSQLDVLDLAVFEDIAHCMARHADPKNVPDTAEAWLDEFNVFSIYQILPVILELWALNTAQTIESKKNFARVSGK